MTRISVHFALLGLLMFGLILGSSATQRAFAATPGYTVVPIGTHAHTTPTPHAIAGRQHRAIPTHTATPDSNLPHLVTTVTTIGANGTPILPDNTVIVPKYPYTLTFTVTVTNAGATPVTVPATLSLEIDVPYATSWKPTYQPLPKLSLGQSTTVTKKVAVRAPGDVLVFVGADAYGQVNEDSSAAFVIMSFTLQSPHTNVSIDEAALIPPNGTPHVGDGTTPGEKLNAFFSISNSGSTPLTHDLPVQFTSAIIGKTMQFTVPAAQLPAPGSSTEFLVSDAAQTPLLFTVPPTATPRRVLLRVRINQPRTFSEDTTIDNTYKTTTEIVPFGVNLHGSVYPVYQDHYFTGQTTFLNLSIANGGTVNVATPFTVQVMMDGKPLGAPITWGSVDAGQTSTLAVPVIVTKAGFHTFGVRVDTTHTVKEYNESDNTLPAYMKYYFL